MSTLEIMSISPFHNALCPWIRDTPNGGHGILGDMVGGRGDIALVHKSVAVNVGKFGKPSFQRHIGILEECMSGERNSDEKRGFVQSYSLKEVVDFVDIFELCHGEMSQRQRKEADGKWKRRIAADL